MNPQAMSWLIFGGGIIAGGLITMFFASLKIGGLRKSIKLKDTRIWLLEKLLEIASKGEEK